MTTKQVKATEKEERKEMSNRIYKELECGCLESADDGSGNGGFIPNSGCSTHGTIYDVPITKANVIKYGFDAYDLHNLNLVVIN